MSTNRLVVEVIGLPAAMGSKKHVGRGIMVESSAKLLPWQQEVKLAARKALEETPLWDRNLSHVSMHVVFTLPRPKGHYRIRDGEASTILKPGMPMLHGTRPDLDKLLRGVCDALTAAGAYADDSRVAHVYALKCYPSTGALPVGALDTPGARIVLSPVGDRVSSS